MFKAVAGRARRRPVPVMPRCWASVMPVTRLLRAKWRSQPVRDGVRRADRCDDKNDFCQVVVTAAGAGLVTDRKIRRTRSELLLENLNLPFRVVWFVLEADQLNCQNIERVNVPCVVRNKSFADSLLIAPWWFADVVIGFVVFGGIRWGLPIWAERGQYALQIICKSRRSAGSIGICSSLELLPLPHICSPNETAAWLMNKPALPESLRKISWKDFEYMVAEAYRRQGFQVE